MQYYIDSRIRLALDNHRGEMMKHLDEREDAIADAVAEVLVAQIKKLREEINELRTKLMMMETNADGRTTPIKGKGHVAA